MGLELDCDGMRVVKLKGSQDCCRIVTRDQAHLPPGAVVEGVVADVNAVADTLRELWHRTRIGNRRVVLGVLNQGVLMRLVNFPAVPRHQLARALRFQAGDFFPIPLEQLVLDFAVVGRAGGEQGTGQEILLVAAQREMLDPSLQALAKAGLKPAIVDFSLLALLRVLPANHEHRDLALLYISRGWGGLLVVSRGVPRLARLLSQQVQWQAGISGWMLALVDAVSSSLRYYLTQSGAEQIQVIYTCGPGAGVAGLAELLQDALGVPVCSIDPQENRPGLISPGDDQGRDGALFALSTGLALRGLEA